MILIAVAAFALQAQADQPVKPVKEKKICRSVMKTGSRMAESECHSAAEWKQIDQDRGVDAQDFQRMQSQMSPH